MSPLVAILHVHVSTRCITSYFVAQRHAVVSLYSPQGLGFRVEDTRLAPRHAVVSLYSLHKRHAIVSLYSSLYELLLNTVSWAVD